MSLPCDDVSVVSVVSQRDTKTTMTTRQSCVLWLALVFGDEKVCAEKHFVGNAHAMGGGGDDGNTEASLQQVALYMLAIWVE